MLGRIRDSCFLKIGKPAFGRDKDVVADVVFADQGAEEGLVDACCVHDGSVPECAAEFDGFEEDSFGLFECQLVPRPKDRSMAPKPGLLISRPDEPNGSVLTMMGGIGVEWGELKDSISVTNLGQTLLM